MTALPAILAAFALGWWLQSRRASKALADAQRVALEENMSRIVWQAEADRFRGLSARYYRVLTELEAERVEKAERRSFVERN